MTCAKRQVSCYITTADGGATVIGTNACLRPQQSCPREPGEGYDKCKSICQQGAHAEMDALETARDAGLNLHGATATLFGHYWICEPCGRALAAAGVARVTMAVKA
jgi:deoxycytidylate deaminase